MGPGGTSHGRRMGKAGSMDSMPPGRYPSLGRSEGNAQKQGCCPRRMGHTQLPTSGRAWEGATSGGKISVHGAVVAALLLLPYFACHHPHRVGGNTAAAAAALASWRAAAAQAVVCPPIGWAPAAAPSGRRSGWEWEHGSQSCERQLTDVQTGGEDKVNPAAVVVHPAGLTWAAGLEEGVSDLLFKDGLSARLPRELVEHGSTSQRGSRLIRRLRQHPMPFAACCMDVPIARTTASRSDLALVSVDQHVATSVRVGWKWRNVSTKQQFSERGLPLPPMHEAQLLASGPALPCQRGLVLPSPSAAASAASAASQSKILLPPPCSCPAAPGAAGCCCAPAVAGSAACWRPRAAALATVPRSRWRIHRRLAER